MKAKRGLLIVLTVLMMLAALPITAMAASPKLSKTRLELMKGATYKLKVKNTKAKVTWKSSKKSVATVSSKGVVTAKKKGNATITATVSGKSYKCKVYVFKEKKEEIDDVTSYVVQAGIYDDQLNLARQYISVRAITSDAFFRQKDGRYYVIAGTFKDLNEAILRRNHLVNLGVAAVVVPE